MAAGAVEGSCRWWSRGHRAHHRYVDTDRDPYACIFGFWHAHIGWMLVRQDPDKIGIVDVSDLDADPLVRKEGLFNRFYIPIALFMGFVLPTLVCGLGWGDWYGGYFIAGVARLVFVHHSTFCVNSVAHYIGAATFTDGHTARNSIITAFLTLGEGYHNFHHEFPSDYRNGVRWYEYDPTKVFIYALSLVGLAYNLTEFPQNEIDKGMLQMRQRELNELKRGADWGPDPAALPRMTRAEFDALVSSGAEAAEGGGSSSDSRGASGGGRGGGGSRGVSGSGSGRSSSGGGGGGGGGGEGSLARGRKLVILDGFVLDVEPFLQQHPGGAGILLAKVGKDVSFDFSQHERPLADGDPPELSRPQPPRPGAAVGGGGGGGRVVGHYKHSNAARSLAETMRIARIDGYVLPPNSSASSMASAVTGGFALGSRRKVE